MIELTLGTLLSGLLLGFFGSAHCLGMCGGISGSLGLAIPVGPHYRRRQFALIATYNLGRITSYSVLGALIALPGMALEMSHGHAGAVLRTGAGLLMIALGLSVGQWWQGVKKLERLGMPLWSRLAPLTRKLMPVTSPAKALLLGLAWGWLPCGLVYSTLGWAALQGSAAGGALAMAAFGLGTAPAMFATGMAARRVERWRNRDWFRHLAGGMIVLFGLWTIPAVRGMLLHGAAH
ncbi:sulfite exporter TauE/SafE family protein [Hydrocarboniclastica marina]|uniref:Sulfite exporter TauE/SafE family protein n=1 Tax=Hydrocarboniclastica marina TaxID=2259620 RepID=A0A4P7XF92_9ALTE|nr:sulfite exporter TauE/SafE family protein [Hydrocarboniclastica marina]